MEKLELTVEEAIRAINCNMPISGYYVLRTALEMAKEALEKEEPMKVTDIHVDEYYCPKCGNENICDEGIIGHKYCPECGQRIVQ